MFYKTRNYGQLISDIDLIDKDKDNLNVGSSIHEISFPKAAIRLISTKSHVGNRLPKTHFTVSAFLLFVYYTHDLVFCKNQ